MGSTPIGTDTNLAITGFAINGAADAIPERLLQTLPLKISEIKFPVFNVYYDSYGAVAEEYKPQGPFKGKVHVDCVNGQHPNKATLEEMRAMLEKTLLSGPASDSLQTRRVVFPEGSPIGYACRKAANDALIGN